MENSAEIFYILIVVALTLKGMLDIIWKKTSKKITETPPFDASQEIERTVVKQNKMKKKPNDSNKIPTNTIRHETQESLSHAVTVMEKQEPTLSIKEEEVFDMPAIQNADDMKKAVIYSEILNRKCI